MEIGMKIRSLRKKIGFSQEEMAQQLNMSQNNYSKIELGLIKLTIDRTRQIAEILESDVFFLITDELVEDAHTKMINNKYADKLITYLENQIAELKAQLLEKDSQIALLEKQRIS